MKTYNIIDKNTHKVVNTVQADLDFLTANYAGFDFAEVQDEGEVEPRVYVDLTLDVFQSDDPNEIQDLAHRELTCKAGSNITAQATLSDLTVNETYRTPMVNRTLDGNTKYLLIEFINGVANISIPIADSGKWLISNTLVNAGLTPESIYFNFEDIILYIVE